MKTHAGQVQTDGQPRNWKRDVFTGANKHLQPQAIAAFKRALRTGDLVRMPCEACGNPRSHGHHEDYAQPLDIVWLCAIHHRQRHSDGDSLESIITGCTFRYARDAVGA